jgi:hypothetical protein
MVALAACAADEGTGDAAPPEPLVIESPRTPVVVGTDTVLVFEPTMFAYYSVEMDETRPSSALLEFAQEFQTGVQQAHPTLQALGIRVETVIQVPRVLGMSPEADASAGPPLEGAPFGYLFVDAVGHVRRVTTRLETTGMVCAAAGTFGLTLDAQWSAACG